MDHPREAVALVIQIRECNLDLITRIVKGLPDEASRTDILSVLATMLLSSHLLLIKDDPSQKDAFITLMNELEAVLPENYRPILQIIELALIETAAEVVLETQSPSLKDTSRDSDHFLV